jgi:hypothetical protein
MYKLHRNPAECDSDNWGQPDSKHKTLAGAMAAAGHPDPSAWNVLAAQCPGEVFTPPHTVSPSWSILAPGAAAEAMTLGVEDVDVLSHH